MRLEQLAEIRTGLVVGRKLMPRGMQSQFRYRQLTLGSLTENKRIDFVKLEVVFAYEEIPEQYLAKQGDIVIRLSVPNIAVVVGQEESGIIIPSQFAIARVIDKSVLPEYLSIAINATDIQRQMHYLQKGSAIKVIDTDVIRNLEITIPNIDKQNQIINIHTLSLQRQNIYEQLMIMQKLQRIALTDMLIKGDTE